VFDRRRADLVRLAAADEEARIGAIATAADVHHGHGASRSRERLELLDIFGIGRCAYA
jgi:hypothetical protein